MLYTNLQKLCLPYTLLPSACSFKKAGTDTRIFKRTKGVKLYSVLCIKRDSILGFVLYDCLYLRYAFNSSDFLSIVFFVHFQEIGFFDDINHSTGALCTQLSSHASKVQGVCCWTFYLTPFAVIFWTTKYVNTLYNTCTLMQAAWKK